MALDNPPRLRQFAPPMANLTSLCVYCGSRIGDDPAFTEAARALGEALARDRIRLVYGGGGIGLMGEVARAALAHGGEAVGIIPQALHGREIAQASLTTLEIVPDMHHRKRRMFDLSDAFVVLPGGVGTLDETVEMITWAQLGFHEKPILLVDIGGYWGPFIRLLEDIVAHDFATRRTLDFYSVVKDVRDVIPTLRAALSMQ
jgi:uncharacterized protein (TIGR00730 family)